MQLSLPKRFPLFILASVCWPLQYLISTLTQGGSGVSFFRLTSSVVLWGGRNTADKYPWCLWGVLPVSRPHWVCPNSGRVCFPILHCSGSRLLCQELSEAGPGLSALPRPKLLRFRFSGMPQRCRLCWACVFVPFPGPSSSGDQVLGELGLTASPVPGAQFSGCTMGAPFQVCPVSPLGS